MHHEFDRSSDGYVWVVELTIQDTFGNIFTELNYGVNFHSHTIFLRRALRSPFSQPFRNHSMYRTDL